MLKCKKNVKHYCELCGKETKGYGKLCNVCKNKGEKSHLFGRDCSKEKNPMFGKKQSESAKRKIGLANKGKTPWNKGLTKETDERVKNISIKISGKNHHWYGKLPKHSGKGKRVYYKGICFRSTYEHTRAKFLDSLGIIWKYEEKTFDLGINSYTPDFFIYDIYNNLIRIEEVKGWFTDDAKEKIKLFKEQYKDEASKLKMVYKKDLEKL